MPARRASAGLPLGMKQPNFSGLTEIMRRKVPTTAGDLRLARGRQPTGRPSRITGLPPSPRLWRTRPAILPSGFSGSPAFWPSALLTLRLSGSPVLWLSGLPTIRPSAVSAVERFPLSNPVS
jgi:hypothetical protein